MAKPILEMQHISKRFGTTQALDDVSLTLYPGEIHALLGENGAGKSTLIKIMTGIYKPDEGEILLDGRSQQPTHLVLCCQLPNYRLVPLAEIVGVYGRTVQLSLTGEQISQLPQHQPKL